MRTKKVKDTELNYEIRGTKNNNTKYIFIFFTKLGVHMHPLSPK